MTATREPKSPDEAADLTSKRPSPSSSEFWARAFASRESPTSAARLEIEFYSAEDLDRIYSVIVGEHEA